MEKVMWGVKGKVACKSVQKVQRMINKFVVDKLKEGFIDANVKISLKWTKTRERHLTRIDDVMRVDLAEALRCDV